MKKQKPASKASKKEAKLLKRKERVSQKSENENEQPGDDAEGTTSAKHSHIMDKPNTGLFSLHVYYHRHSQILRTIVFYISCLIWDLHFLALKGSDFFLIFNINENVFNCKHSNFIEFITIFPTAVEVHDMKPIQFSSRFDFEVSPVF